MKPATTPLTPGAERSLQRAKILAARDGTGKVRPLHLLWGLHLSETAASGLLDSFGLDRAELERIAPLPVVDAGNGDASTRAEPRDTKFDGEPSDTARSDAEQLELIDLGYDCQQALAAARSIVRRAHDVFEIGSEHLLCGLTAAKTDVASLLHSRGMRCNSILAQSGQSGDVFGEPIAIDLEIENQSDRRERHTASESSIGETVRRHRTNGQAEDVARGGDVHDRVHRILDAAANRAREGLRVVEDFTRFVLDDGHLTELFKTCRHDLASALARFDQRTLLTARDTPADVGTRISTDAEQCRPDIDSVVRANLKRTQEALRTIEEFSKLLLPSVGESVQQIRYRHYTIEQAVLTTLAARNTFDGRNVYLLLTESVCRQPWQRVLEQALHGGISIVQLREKSLTDRELLQRGRIVRGLTRDAGALFIMNDRPDLAVSLDADGVHLGQDEMPATNARRIVGPSRLIGVSTHSVQQATQAVLDGADYIGCGPVFESTTKSFPPTELVGLELVTAVAKTVSLPVFAIGGITLDNVSAVQNAGATRIAVSSAICRTDDVEQTSRELVDRVSFPIAATEKQ